MLTARVHWVSKKKIGFNFVYACCWGVWWAFQTLPIKACEEGLLVYFRNNGYDEHFARQHVDFQDMLCQLLPNSFNVFCHETSVHRWILIGSLKMIKWLYLLRFLPPFAGTWLERSPWPYQDVLGPDSAKWPSLAFATFFVQEFLCLLWSKIPHEMAGYIKPHSFTKAFIGLCPSYSLICPQKFNQYVCKTLWFVCIYYVDTCTCCWTYVYICVVRYHTKNIVSEISYLHVCL